MISDRDIIAEANRQSTAAMDAALGCIAYGQREPALAPIMVGCAFGCAGLGIAIASVGIFAGLWRAAQAGAETENTTAH